MSAYDVQGRATAARMLAPISSGGKGQAITLTRTIDGAYDPAAGAPAVTATTDACVGVVFEYSTFIRSGQREERGATIQNGDKQLILSALSAAGAPLALPRAGDMVTVAGANYTITAVAPLAPAGTPIYYECNIRGAA